MNSANILADKLSSNRVTTYWLKNAAFSLIIAGIYSVILIFLRIPILSYLLSKIEIFSINLIVQANLLIVIWFLSIVACLWTHTLQNSVFSITWVILAGLSTTLIALSPFCRQNSLLINNYLPIYENIIFILGISLFGIILLLLAFHLLYSFALKNWFHVLTYRTLNNKISSSGIFSNKNNYNYSTLINFTSFSTAILFILMWVCFSLSYLQLRKIIKLIPVSIEFYYELLLWSGGHLLQFIYSQILILIWLTLFYSWFNKKSKFTMIYLILLCLNLVIAAIIPLGHLLYNIVDDAFKAYYRWQVTYRIGIVPILVFILMVYDLVRSQTQTTFLNKNKVKFNSNKLILIRSGILLLWAGIIAVLITTIHIIGFERYYSLMFGISIVSSLLFGITYGRKYEL